MTSRRDRDILNRLRSCLGVSTSTSVARVDGRWSRCWEWTTQNVGLLGLLLSAVSIVVAVLSWGNSQRALKLAKAANQIAATSGRAWIDVDAQQRSAIATWHDGSLTVRASFDVANSGREPATDAQVFMRVIAEPGFLDIPKPERDTCHYTGYADFWSTVLAPQGRATMLREATIQVDQLQTSKAIVGPTGKQGPKLGDATDIGIVICAVYHIHGDGEWHHTARAYELFGLRADKPVSSGLDRITVGRNLVSGDTFLRPSENGDFAD